MSSYTQFITKLSASLHTVIMHVLCAGSPNSISFLEYVPLLFELYGKNSVDLAESTTVLNDVN